MIIRLKIEWDDGASIELTDDGEQRGFTEGSEHPELVNLLLHKLDEIKSICGEE